MMAIIGNEKNIRHFDGALRQGRLSHAYLICGQKGSGKKTLVSYIAEGLLCDTVKHRLNDSQSGRPESDEGLQSDFVHGRLKNDLTISPCGKCPSCLKVQTGNHPDLIYVTHKKENNIAVGEIREQVVEDISVKPYYGPHKIYIIDEADLMNVNAQNALLKTIEEPPEYGLIFLLTDNPDGLLETVRSRCVRIDMDILSDEQVKNLLIKEYDADMRTAEDAALFAKGNAGRAAAIVKGGKVSEARDMVSDMMKRINELDASDLAEKAKKIESGDTKEILELIRTWFRDELLVKATGSEENLYFSSENITIKNQAQKISYENIEKIFEMIDETFLQINANVKAEAAVWVLLLGIRDKLG